MSRIISILPAICFSLGYCLNAIGQSNFFVHPIATHSGYLAAQDSHFVSINRSVNPNNKLLVFIPGTGASAKTYQYLPTLAANLGYHAITISYPNSKSAGSACASKPNDNCYTYFREEACFGTPVSDEIDIDSLNSIAGRIKNLLNYLNLQFPFDGWGDYIDSDQLNFSKIAFAGHSQGAGHALYFAKQKQIQRALLFSGPQDYNYFNTTPATWMWQSGATPTSSIFSFSHLRDEVSYFEILYKGVQAMGLTTQDDSTSVDGNPSPFQFSHCLYTNEEPKNPITPSPFHNATVVDFNTPGSTLNPFFTSVWQYMLSSTGAPNNLTDQASPDNGIQLFPNPARNWLNLYISHPLKNQIVKLRNTQGMLVWQGVPEITGNLISISLESIQSGMYTLEVDQVVYRVSVLH